MSTQHTPGPWGASQSTNRYGAIDAYWLIRSGSGVQIADLFGLTGEQDEDGDDARIPNEEAAANARLIAAAPDLLAACKSAHETLLTFARFGVLTLPHEQQALDLLRAAIAKAHGAGPG